MDIEKFDTVEEFIKYINDVEYLNTRTSSGDTYLHVALHTYCRRDEARVQSLVRCLLQESPELSHIQNHAQENALALACRLGASAAVLRLLLHANPQAVNDLDKDDNTPLHLYLQQCWYFDAEILGVIEEMASNMLDINVENKNGKSVLMECLFNMEGVPNSSVLNIILRQPRIKLYSRNKSLHYFQMIRFFNVSDAKFALNLESVSINEVDINNYTPLHWAICHPRNIHAHKIIDIMIKKGARIENGVNVFELVEENYCNWDIVIRLLNIYPQYVNYRDREGATLLTNYGINPKIIKKLLSLGADPTILSNDIRGPLTIACIRGDMESVKMLIHAGADPLSYTSLELYRLMESSKWMSFLRYLLKLPQFKDRNMPENLALFYIMLVIQLAKHHHWRGRESKVKKTLKLLIKRNPSIINLKSVNCHLSSTTIPNVDLLSHIVLKSDLSLDDLYIFISLLLKCKFTDTQIPANQITPLTALMFSYKTNRPVCAYDNVLFQLFINKGIDINSYALNNYPDLIKTSNVYNHLELHIKIHFDIPDVLFLAVRYKISDVVWRMLEHWWGPPMLLVTVFPRNEGIYSEEYLYSRWFPMLLEYGGVPHGIPLFMYYEATIKFWIQTADNSEYYIRYRSLLKRCYQTLRSPLSLVELCKYAVRQSVSARAKQGDITLPALLHDLLPPLLRKVVIH